MRWSALIRRNSIAKSYVGWAGTPMERFSCNSSCSFKQVVGKLMQSMQSAASTSFSTPEKYQLQALAVGCGLMNKAAPFHWCSPALALAAGRSLRCQVGEDATLWCPTGCGSRLYHTCSSLISILRNICALQTQRLLELRGYQVHVPATFGVAAIESHFSIHHEKVWRPDVQGPDELSPLWSQNASH